jgi:uncharacterized protein (DUF433 family)
LSFFDLVDALRGRKHAALVERDASGLPVRLYPGYPGCPPASRIIAIDPWIAFGRPVIVRAGVSTRAIKSRTDSGERAAAIAADYDLTDEEVRQALLFERSDRASLARQAL